MALICRYCRFNFFLYFKVNYFFKKADDYVEKSKLIQTTLQNFSKCLPVKPACLWKKRH